MTLPNEATNVSRDIWNNNIIRDNKILGMFLIKVNKPGPRRPFTVEKAKVRGNIKASA